MYQATMSRIFSVCLDFHTKKPPSIWVLKRDLYSCYYNANQQLRQKQAQAIRANRNTIKPSAERTFEAL